MVVVLVAVVVAEVGFPGDCSGCGDEQVPDGGFQFHW